MGMLLSLAIWSVVTCLAGLKSGIPRSSVLLRFSRTWSKLETWTGTGVGWALSWDCRREMAVCFQSSRPLQNHPGCSTILQHSREDGKNYRRRPTAILDNVGMLLGILCNFKQHAACLNIQLTLNSDTAALLLWAQSTSPAFWIPLAVRQLRDIESGIQTNRGREKRGREIEREGGRERDTEIERERHTHTHTQKKNMWEAHSMRLMFSIVWAIWTPIPQHLSASQDDGVITLGLFWMLILMVDDQCLHGKCNGAGTTKVQKAFGGWGRSIRSWDPGSGKGHNDKLTN